MILKLKTGRYLDGDIVKSTSSNILFRGLVFYPWGAQLEEWHSINCFEPKNHLLTCDWYKGKVIEEQVSKPKVLPVSKNLKSLMDKFKDKV